MTLAQDGYHVFTVNVSAENIHDAFCRLASEVNEPAFLLLETGTHRDIEQELRKNDTDPFHKDVYYLDGLNWPTASAYFRMLLTLVDLWATGKLALLKLYFTNMSPQRLIRSSMSPGCSKGT
ncbi:MAG: hypothetical protein ACYTG0_16780 [Planctomycetota bacterium]